MCGRYGATVPTPFEEHGLSERTTAFILATDCHTELYDCHEEESAWTLKEQDHNTRDQILELPTVNHTGLLNQLFLSDAELGRAAISFHYAVGLQMGAGGSVWSTGKKLHAI